MARNNDCIARLTEAGITIGDAHSLRRIAMTLHRWHELECGTDYGCVERDEDTGKTYWLNSYTSRRTPMADRETGALNRLDIVMRRYAPSGLSAYVQGDPRGAALYILRAGDVPEGENAESYYNRGIAVYK